MRDISQITRFPIIFLLALAGCKSVEPFSSRIPYVVERDPFIPAYVELLEPIAGLPFDGGQVSNKHLDPLLIEALHRVNEVLANPERHLPLQASLIRQSGISGIRLASAARSPWLQARLSAPVKAGYLKSYHLLGLAADLEMEGTPFDMRQAVPSLSNTARYALLGDVLRHCGLIFPDPGDPNHVELWRFCRKHNPTWDQAGLHEREQRMLRRLLKTVDHELPRTSPLLGTDSRQAQKNWLRLRADLAHELHLSSATKSANMPNHPLDNP